MAQYWGHTRLRKRSSVSGAPSATPIAEGRDERGCRNRCRRRRGRGPRRGAGTGQGRPRGHGLEQHALIGSETSSRNSEVIHAGIYYPPRQSACWLVRARQGAALSVLCRAACRMRVVANCWWPRTSQRLPKLAAIRETAVKNGVADLNSCLLARLRRSNPSSPASGAALTLDGHHRQPRLSCWRSEGHIETSGGTVRVAVSRRAHRAGRECVPSQHGGAVPGQISCHKLVLSAGLHASRLARMLELCTRLSATGDLLCQGAILRAIRTLPIQAAHLSPAGRRLAEPPCHRRHRRALQVWTRHQNGTPGIDYSFRPEKLDQFLDFIRSYYPALEVDRLHPDYTGVRPKLYREGEPVPRLCYSRRRRMAWMGWCACSVSRAPASRRRLPSPSTSSENSYSVKAGSLRAQILGSSASCACSMASRRRSSSPAGLRMTFCACTAATASRRNGEIAGILDVDDHAHLAAMPRNLTYRAERLVVVGD